MKWSKSIKSYYTQKGYVFTKYGDCFEVKVEDLSKGCKQLVLVQCDYCGKQYKKMYSVHIKNTANNPKCACQNCGNIKQREVIKAKYGVDNISQLPEIQDKIRQNNLKKYGVSNPSQLSSIKEKVKQSSRQKYGVDYYQQTKEYKESVQKTSLNKYGVSHFTQSTDVIKKRKATNLEKYGVEYPIQNREILLKSMNSRYQHGNFTCSKNQYKLYKEIGGNLNYPFQKFVIDVAFPEEKIAVEWDGSGHDLSVRLGHITSEAFLRNENFRKISLFDDGWKIIRFISLHDHFPKNIHKIFDYCYGYLQNGGHYIEVIVDTETIKFKDKEIKFDDL